MSSYKQFLTIYYCIIKDNSLLPIKSALNILFKMIQSINDSDIELYNQTISNKFDNILDTLNSSEQKENIIKEIKNQIKLTSEMNDSIYRDIINTIMNTINKYIIVIMNQRNSYSSKNVINAEFLNNEFTKLGTIDGPTFAKQFTNLKYFNKSSASPTIIISGRMNPSKISNSIKSKNSNIIDNAYYMKLFRTDKYNTELIKELNIYECLFNLTKYNITPNILNRIYTGKIMNILEFFENVKGKEDIYKQIKGETALEGSFLNNEGYVIMTEPGTDTLEQLLSGFNYKNTPSAEINTILNNIYIQIFYTLYVMSQIRFGHNDLHYGNIFIQTLDSPIQLNYKVMGKYYSITTKHLVKIYDFDHSSIYSNVQVKNKMNSFNLVKTDNMAVYNYLNRFDLSIIRLTIAQKHVIGYSKILDDINTIINACVDARDNFGIMKNVWLKLDYLKQFEVFSIDEKQNLVYTIDDYEITYS